jgi:hypothetical protein
MDRFAGRPIDNGCSSIPVGDAVTKLPVPSRLKVKLSHVRRGAKGFTMKARVTHGIGTAVSAKVFAVRKGKRTLVKTVASSAELTTTAQRLKVPVKGLHAGRKYVVIVRATVAGRQVRGTSRGA